MALDSKVPQGPLKDKWTDYKNHINLVNPANKRHIDVIVVGTGLAGGSASATLAELGYNENHLRTKTLHVERILLQHREELMQQKITKEMEILPTDYFTIL